MRIDGYFERTYIEKWILWLKNERSCSPDTCNNRMSTFRGFLKYLGSKDIKLMHLYEESRSIHRLKTLKKKVTGVSKKGIQELLNQPDLGTKIIFVAKYHPYYLLYHPCVI
jgi:site-specific recombinase XerD